MKTILRTHLQIPCSLRAFTLDTESVRLCSPTSVRPMGPPPATPPPPPRPLSPLPPFVRPSVLLRSECGRPANERAIDSRSNSTSQATLKIAYETGRFWFAHPEMKFGH